MELKTVLERYHGPDLESRPEEADATPDVIEPTRGVGPATSKFTGKRLGWLTRRELALATLVLVLGASLAVALWPETFKGLLQDRGAKIVGVPDASTATVTPNTPGAASEQTVASVNQTPSQVPPAPAEGPNDPAGSAADLDPQQPPVAQDANAGAAITSSETSSPPSVTQQQADIPTSVTTRVPAKTKAVTSAPRRAFVSPNRAFGRGSARARVLGTTLDGSVILGLPSGRTVVVAAPAANYVPHRRLYYGPFERRAVFVPPPFAPVFPAGY